MAKRLIATLNDSTLFLREWLADPQRTGSVTPSSPKLAAPMAGWLPAAPESYVLEPGLREERLVAIENNPKMARLLRQRFPRARIITGDAWHLDVLLRECHEPIESVGAVISSLPLLNFPPDEADALAEKIRAILDHGGKWVQYSYHLGNGHHKSAAHFQRLASKIIWLNLPPARVNVYQK